MSKFLERSRITLKPNHDTTVPDRGLVVPITEAEDAMIASLLQRETGLAGILVDLEKECRQYLHEKGAVFRDIDRRDPRRDAFLFEDLRPVAELDPYSNEICSLYLSVVCLMIDIDTLDLDARPAEFGFRIFQIGAAAESAKLATVRKYAVTGKKIQCGGRKGNQSKDRAEKTRIRHQEILKDAEGLRSSGYCNSSIAGCLSRRYKSEGLSPASPSRIRTILRENNFYKRNDYLAAE